MIIRFLNYVLVVQSESYWQGFRFWSGFGLVFGYVLRLGYVTILFWKRKP